LPVSTDPNPALSGLISTSITDVTTFCLPMPSPFFHPIFSNNLDPTPAVKSCGLGGLEDPLEEVEGSIVSCDSLSLILACNFCLAISRFCL
jgi:hypothetical protein